MASARESGAPSRPSRSGTLAPWWIAAGAIVAADQLTKWLASEFMCCRPPLEVTPFFNLVLAHNTGAAFSFLAGAEGWQRWLFTGIAAAAVVLISLLLKRHAGEKLFCLGLALILGGAVGNLVDRLLWGHVIDFIQLHAGGWYWPSFNIADSGITVGAALVILDSIRGKPRLSES